MARTRYQGSRAPFPLRRLPFAALRESLREGYGARDLRSDVLAGAVVGVVALPLAMALAVAVGVPPQHGLHAAVVGGGVIALLGGSRTQVSGPTAAFIVILAPIVARFGLAGLLVAGLMGGILLVLAAVLRLGRFIEFIPYPVTTGFTSGIAVVIAGLQLKDLLGLRPERSPEHFFERLASFFEARHTFDPWALAVGAFTLLVLHLWPRASRRIPAPLVALPAAAALAWALARWAPGVAVDTIASRFRTVVDGVPVAGIPRLPPLFVLPWEQPGAGGAPFALDWGTLRLLLPSAFAVAVLGAIESLLSAVVADGMARTEHDPDAELLAQGIGNVVGPFLGAIPATGAIARTATNVRSGGRSPVAAIVHAGTVLLAVLALAPLLGLLPMAALSALLLRVAWNMSEAKHFFHVVRVAPRHDVAVLLACFGLTVAFDMVIGVSVGMVLAVFLFMQRMAEITRGTAVESGGHHPALPGPVPQGVVVYDVSGALFFGAAQKAVGALHAIAARARAVVLRLHDVHAMDATGLVALESAAGRLAKGRCALILAGVKPQPRELLERAGFFARPGVRVAADDAEALALAGEAGARPVSTPPPA